MKLKLMSSHTNILAKEVGNVSLEKDYLQFSVKSTQFWVFDSNIPVVSMSILQDLQFCNLYYEKQLNQVCTDKLVTLQCAFHGSSAYNREGDTSNCTLWWLQ